MSAEVSCTSSVKGVSSARGHRCRWATTLISADSTVIIKAVKVNEGTTLFCDGQASTHLHAGERIVIKRSEQPALLSGMSTVRSGLRILAVSAMK